MCRVSLKEFQGKLHIPIASELGMIKLYIPKDKGGQQSGMEHRWVCRRIVHNRYDSLNRFVYKVTHSKSLQQQVCMNMISNGHGGLRDVQGKSE